MTNTEDFIIVWLDENKEKTTDYFDTKHQLRYVIQYLQIFSDTDECIDFITSQRMNSIFFLVSETLSKTVISHVHELTQVVSIYLLGNLESHYFENYSKVVGSFADKKRLISKLIIDIAKYTRITISVSILAQNATKLIHDLSKEYASFMWFQLLIEILLRMDQIDIAKKEMIDECLSQYEDDPIERTTIEDFRNSYDRTKAIWWYTRNCFLYRLLNKALRTENIDMIFKFRFFYSRTLSSIERCIEDFC